jgi:hypothetical protein
MASAVTLSAINADHDDLPTRSATSHGERLYQHGH